MDVGKQRALVVDDDPVTRGYICDVLIEEGFDVDACAEGRSALTVFLQRSPFALLIVDIIMPGMNGTEMVDILCRSSADLRVIFVSAREGPGVLGPHRRFLSKPFSRSTLMAEVRKIMKS